MFAAALAASVLTGPFGIDLTQMPQGCEPMSTFSFHVCPAPDPRFKTFAVETATTGRICYMGGAIHADARREVLEILTDTYGAYSEPGAWTPAPEFGIYDVTFTDSGNLIYMMDHPDCTVWRKEKYERLQAEKAARPRRF